jgi:hypothetical protein
MANTNLIRKTSVSKFYRAWVNMKTRCTNNKVSEYHRYGGRGISYCEKWETFDGFIEDMLPTYEENLTLDRIDNDGNYCKENCRWTTYKEQSNNTRKTERALRYPYQGKMLRTSELAEVTGIKRTTLDMRLRQYDWDITRAITKTS